MKRFVYIFSFLLFSFQYSLNANAPLAIEFKDPIKFVNDRVYRVYGHCLLRGKVDCKGVLKKTLQSKFDKETIVKWLLNFYEPAENIHVGIKLYEHTAKTVCCNILCNKIGNWSCMEDKDTVVSQLVPLLAKEWTVKSFMRELKKGESFVKGYFLRTLNEMRSREPFLFHQEGCPKAMCTDSKKHLPTLCKSKVGNMIASMICTWNNQRYEFYKKYLKAGKLSLEAKKAE